MKKRSRKVLLVSLGAVVVALLALALVYRERPPFEFLNGEERVRTTLSSNSPGRPTYATTTYVSDLSPSEIGERAKKELAPKGWHCSERVCSSPGITAEVWTGEFGLVRGRFAWDERLLGKTYISTSRPATAIDRFNAWLDRMTGR